MENQSIKLSYNIQKKIMIDIIKTDKEYTKWMAYVRV